MTAMNANTRPDKEQGAYRSFLLRLWKDNSGWRASLQDPLTRRRFGFSSLEELFAFLMEESHSALTQPLREPGARETAESASKAKG